VNNIKGGPQ